MSPTAFPNPGSAPRSLRSSSSKLAQLTLEQILEHLDNLRLNLTNTKQNCRPSSGGGGRGGPGAWRPPGSFLTALCLLPLCSL